VVTFTFLAYGTQCAPSSKWHCGAPYFPFHITLNVLDHNQLMENKGLGKMLHCKSECNTSSAKAPINETI
jgi:hypothetical protein